MRRLWQLAAVLVVAGGCGLASAQGLLIVLNKQEHTLVAVDPATLKVVGRVATGNGPHEVATSADGKLAFVANYGAQQPGNSLSVIDLVAMKELRRVDLGALVRPHGIAEHRGKIYFTSEASRSVARYDPAADKVDWLMGTGATATHMLALAPDGGRLYTANIGSNTVTSLAIGAPGANIPPIVQIAVGTQPEAIDVSPNGKEVWAGHNGDGRISIIDTATNTVKDSFKAGDQPIRIKFTPDGRRVLVSDPRGGEFVIIDAATRKDIRRMKMAGLPIGIQLQPDGKRAYISLAQANRVAVLDLDKLEVVGSIDTGQGPDGLAWSALQR